MLAGALWCVTEHNYACLVLSDALLYSWYIRKRSSHMPKKRYSVSLELDDYERIKKLAVGQKPKLSIQYLTEYAIRLLLERAEDPQFHLELRDPLSRS